mmetsp:Transcript_26740/g.50273  ORF Transcript_26740/g.50273 Transcript_26740/m.50273 type:complete len:83 (+) Transcript_26740:713-961(+)
MAGLDQGSVNRNSDNCFPPWDTSVLAENEKVQGLTSNQFRACFRWSLIFAGPVRGKGRVDSERAWVRRNICPGLRCSLPRFE